MKFLALVLFCLCWFCARAEIPQDANAELATAYRSDVVGPEMWTGTPRGGRYHTFRGTAASYAGNELPFLVYEQPAPGLSGQLNVINRVVDVKDVISLRIEDGDEALAFVPVRNHWTPAFVETYYRALPTREQSCSDGDRVGATVLKERKAILTDNTFVADATIKNVGSCGRTYRVRVVSAGGLPNAGERPRRWGMTVDCRKIPVALNPYSAVGTTQNEASQEFEFQVAAHDSVTFRYGFSLSPESEEDAKARLGKAFALTDPFGENVRQFNAWFDRNVPRLDVGDPDLRRMYLYRWFVVKRNMHRAARISPEHPYPRTVFCESPVGGSYNAVVGLPVPLQIQELAWMRDPGPAVDHVLNWCDKVHGYRGYVQYTVQAVAQFLRLHPDASLARRIFPALKEFALETSGGDAGKLPVQVGSWGVGAEYQPNFYQFVEPKWDARHDGHFGPKEGFSLASLVRLDTAVFGIGNLRGAEEIARSIGDRSSEAELARLAAGQLAIIRTRHWNDEKGLFLAADPTTYALADEAPCYDSFTPYMWGLVGGEFLKAFERFCDPRWFWDDFPISSCSKTCQMYRGENVLMTPPIGSPEKPFCRGSCWNGPTWHYADTLAAEAFGRAARAEPKWRGRWLDFFRGWTESHYLFGDRTAMRAAEDIRPEDGTRCGVTWDYFHSAWIDPFVRYWCGIDVAEDGTVVFEPFSNQPFVLHDVAIRGRSLSFLRHKDGMLVISDRKQGVVARGRGRLVWLQNEK